MPTLLETIGALGNDLSDDVVQLLPKVEKGLALVADISRADVALLIRHRDSALVAAQSAPESIATLYRKPWIGRRLRLVEHPLLEGALVHQRRGQHQRNLLQEGTPIIQQVLPLIGPDGPLPAAVQIETNLIAWERHKRRHVSFRRAVVWLQEMLLRGELQSAAGLSRFGEWDGVLLVDETYRITYLSGIANNLYRRLGYLDDLHGKHIGDLQTKDEVLVRQAFATRSCQQHEVEEKGRHWTRTVAPVWNYASPWWLFGRSTQQKPALRGALIMVHDRTEAELKKVELKVLSTMIQEVHHRVKNNLQSVASMLRMQIRRAETEEARSMLQEAENRVMAVATIHEFLSNDDDQLINVRDVCQRIVTQTQRAAVLPDKHIEMQVTGPAISLSSEQATTCALVINELVLNAMLHAFEGRSEGRIRLQLSEEGNQVSLAVCDNGTGLPDDFDLNTSSNLGLNIIRTLVEGDLKGQFILQREEANTCALVTFERSTE